MKWCLAFLIACLSLSPTSAQPVDHATLLDRALGGVIVLAFTGFVEKSKALVDIANAVCTEDRPSADLRAAYADTYVAWMAVDAFRFGPVEERGAALSVNFWPDKKNFVGRALRTLHAATSDQLEDAAFIASQSAAAQGLPALERLIVEGRPCPLTPAIAAHLSRTAQTLESGWTEEDGWASLMRMPGSDNPVYLSPDETSAELYKALQFGLQTLSDARLGRPLGAFDAPRPKRAEAWRSELSRANAIAQFDALQAFYQRTFSSIVEGDALDVKWRAAETALRRIPPSISVGVEQPASRIKIEAAKNRIDALREALGDTLAPRLGIAIGFNSADGD